jgi:hypothetical protein
VEIAHNTPAEETSDALSPGRDLMMTGFLHRQAFNNGPFDLSKPRRFAACGRGHPQPRAGASNRDTTLQSCIKTLPMSVRKVKRRRFGEGSRGVRAEFGVYPERLVPASGLFFPRPKASSG